MLWLELSKDNSERVVIMFKKIISLFLCLLLSLPLIGAHAEESFSEDFDQFNKENWELNYNVGKAKADWSNKFFRFHGSFDDANDAKQRLSISPKSFPKSPIKEKVFKVDYDINITSFRANVYQELVINPGVGADSSSILSFHQGGEGYPIKIGSKLVDTNVKCELNKWYNVSVLIDLSKAQELSITINSVDDSQALLSWSGKLSEVMQEDWIKAYKSTGVADIEWVINGIKRAEPNCDVSYDNISILAAQELKASITMPSGVDESEYKNAINLLSVLKVIEGAKLNPKEQITRAQAVGYALKLSGMYALDLSQPYFGDVTAERSDYGYINTAASLGIVSAAQSFMPDEKATGYQFLTMLLNGAGYRFIAQSSGEWPYGYIKVATKLDMLDGISFKLDAPLTLENMACLAKNFLHIPFANENFSTTETAYSLGDKDYMAYRVFGMNCNRGVLQAADGMSFYSAAPEDNKALISGYYFDMLYTDLAPSFGNYVEYWYDDDAKLYYAFPYASKNITENIISDHVTYNSKLDIKYEDENGKTQKLSTNSNTVILYNGIGLSNPTQSDFDDIDALSVISNDGDNSYDVVNIIKTTSFVVGGANKEFVYAQSGNYRVDFEDKESVKVIKDGKQVKTSEIKKDSVVSVATEKLGNGVVLNSAKYITIYVSDKKINGKVEAIGENFVEINEEEYKLSHSNPAIKLGDWGDFYLDYYGRILAYKPAETIGANYGVITDYGTYTEGLSKKYAWFEIFTVARKSERFSTGEELYINGTKYKADAAVTKLAGCKNAEVITYDFDMYGNLYSINLANDYSAEFPYTPYHEGEFSLDYNNRAAGWPDSRIRVKESGSIISPSHTVNADTIVFHYNLFRTSEDSEGNPVNKLYDIDIVPSGNLFKIEEMSEGNLTEFEKGDMGAKTASQYIRHHTLKVYDADSGGVAKVVYIASQFIDRGTSLEGSDVVQESPVAISKVAVMTEDDTVQIKGIQGKNEVTLVCSPDGVEIYNGTNYYTYQTSPITDVTQLKKGDIIQYLTDYDGYVNYIHVIHNSDMPIDDLPFVYSGSNLTATHTAILSTHVGLVERRNGDYITIDQIPTRSFRITGSTGVTIIRDNGKTITSGTIDDIAVGDKVMICARRQKVWSVYVFRD